MTYYHNYRFNDSILDCELDYEPAERGAREDGVQLEPDYPSTMTLTAAYLNRVDIFELLSEGIIDVIEAAAKEAEDS